MSTTSRRRPSPRRRNRPAVATAAAAPTIPALTAATALSTIPPALRDPLVAALGEIAGNFAAHKWEPSELNGGKLCEAAYTILRGHVDGTWAPKPSKPKDMVTACRDFEKEDKVKWPQSVRVTMPRLLMALYEIRNNRGVGHVGGDVDANHMDAVLVLTGSKWVVAELVRIFHDVRTAEATAIVDALVERVVPAIWTIGDTRRVLVPGLSMKDQTLLLLYASAGWINESALVAAIEHSNASVYRRDVLATAHKDRLIEYDGKDRRAHISPLGIGYVEGRLGKHLIA